MSPPRWHPNSFKRQASGASSRLSQHSQNSNPKSSEDSTTEAVVALAIAEGVVEATEDVVDMVAAVAEVDTAEEDLAADTADLSEDPVEAPAAVDPEMDTAASLVDTNTTSLLLMYP
jgi:hypothetical protein